MTEAQNDVETSPIIDDTKDEPIESNSKLDNIVKAQPSDCSVITLSSEESEMVVEHNISNQKNHEFNDVELFDISHPPPELQDDLFEDSLSNNEMDSQMKRKT